MTTASATDRRILAIPGAVKTNAASVPVSIKPKPILMKNNTGARAAVLFIAEKSRREVVDLKLMMLTAKTAGLVRPFVTIILIVSPNWSVNGRPQLIVSTNSVLALMPSSKDGTANLWAGGSVKTSVLNARRRPVLPVGMTAVLIMAGQVMTRPVSEK